MAIPSSSTVNIMSSDNQCFACGKIGHIGCNCPDVQCYNCEEFSNFTQDCPGNIPPSGTHCCHDRSCTWPHHNHNHSDRSQSLNYRHSHGRCFDWLQSHHQSYHDRSPSNYQRHVFHSPSNHCSSSCYPSTHQCLGNTHTGTHHTGITVTHLDHATFCTRVTLKVIPQTKANLVQATLTLPLTDHTQRKQHNCTQEQQPLINLSARRRSSFRIQNQTPPQNQTKTTILWTTRALFK